MALTSQENEELRRIHTLSEFGELPGIMRARYEELRARDEHLVIEEPTLDITWLPRQRSREGALHDRIDVYEDVDMITDTTSLGSHSADHDQSDFDWTGPIDTAFRTESAPSHMSIADMAAFEAALSGNDFYVASAPAGFAPSSWYGTN